MRVLELYIVSNKREFYFKKAKSNIALKWYRADIFQWFDNIGRTR